MSPSTVVDGEAAAADGVLVASSRTIPFQRVLSSVVPSKSSPGASRCRHVGVVERHQSNFALTAVVAALERAKTPTLAFRPAGRRAGRPSVHVVPSSRVVSRVMLRPVGLDLHEVVVPVRRAELRRRRRPLPLRGVPATSLMNSKCSVTGLRRRRCRRGDRTSCSCRRRRRRSGPPGGTARLPACLIFVVIVHGAGRSRAQDDVLGVVVAVVDVARPRSGSSACRRRRRGPGRVGRPPSRRRGRRRRSRRGSR